MNKMPDHMISSHGMGMKINCTKREVEKKFVVSSFMKEGERKKGIYPSLNTYANHHTPHFKL